MTGTSRFSSRALAAAVLFAATVAGGLEPLYIRMLVTDREQLRASASLISDPHTPRYPLFLDEVRKRTPEGTSIAILAPMRHWQDGYDYAYYRASYLLEGRRVLPLLDRSDHVHLENLDAADYIADWGVTARFPGRKIVWRGSGGALLGRSR
ncbi:MAG: hypothetical protein ABI718_14875 [Acidobacteriota bacterium]